MYYKQYATKVSTNKDHMNLRNVVGEARQDLEPEESELNALLSTKKKKKEVWKPLLNTHPFHLC